MSETSRALIVAAVWLAVALGLRWIGRLAVRRWLRGREPSEAARQRTLLVVLERLILTVVVLIAVWNVLVTFETTRSLGRAFLASGAVIAVFAGVALSTPLGNIGAGVIVAFTQPVRLGDRVSVGDATGFVEQIGAIYTVLRTDDNQRVFVPNTQLTSMQVVNRTIADPRRTVTASLPVTITAPFEEARSVVRDALAGLPLDARIAVGDVGEKVVWLNVTGLAPAGSDVAGLASDVRERALTALGEARYLPT